MNISGQLRERHRLVGREHAAVADPARARRRRRDPRRRRAPRYRDDFERRAAARRRRTRRVVDGHGPARSARHRRDIVPLQREPRSLPGRRRTSIDVSSMTRRAVATLLTNVSPCPGGDASMRAGVAGSRTRRDTRTRDLVLVVAQRARRRRVPGRQVVPRPARAEPSSSNALSSPMMRPSMRWMPALRSASANSANTRRRLTGARRLDRRIAAADDDEIAVKHAALDRAGGVESRRVSVVPAEPLGRGRQREQLHVRRRHDELRRVAPVERERNGVEQIDADRRASRAASPGCRRCRRGRG